MDTFTPEQRHKCMAAIHSRDTKPEIMVRRYLFAQGFRYRLNSSKLPGHPDIVLRKYRTAVFVNGCFWHGHEGCRYFKMPNSNVEFWTAKIRRNQERDRRTLTELSGMGWRCVTVWECALRPKAQRELTLAELAATIREIPAVPVGTSPEPVFIGGSEPRILPYVMPVVPAAAAAEPSAPYETPSPASSSMCGVADGNASSDNASSPATVQTLSEGNCADTGPVTPSATATEGNSGQVVEDKGM